MKVTTSLCGDHHIDWKCPDWKSYNLDHPKLKEHVNILAKHGLKDPWVRNYAWKYAPNVYRTPWQFFKEELLSLAPRGLALALVATAVLRGYDYMTEKRQKENHH